MASPLPAAPCSVHVSCGVKAGDRDTGSLERSPEIDREHDLRQLALTIGSVPAVATGQHYVAEVDRLLPVRRDRRLSRVGETTHLDECRVVGREEIRRATAGLDVGDDASTCLCITAMH